MRLIDGDALIEKFNEKTDMAECLVDARTAERFATFCALADAVEEMPTVDAEIVVRCKDCKYWEPMNKGSWMDRNRTDGVCRTLMEFLLAERYMTEKDHFCGFGERREDDEVD